MTKEKPTIEKCEICGKKITDKMKRNQNVIYCNAEHTLDENYMANDLMYDGVCCSQKCFEELSGIKQARTNTLKKELEFLKEIYKKLCSASVEGDQAIGLADVFDRISEIEGELKK